MNIQSRFQHFCLSASFHEPRQLVRRRLSSVAIGLPLVFAGCASISPALAQAVANIADARALDVTSGTTLLPSLDVAASATRGGSELSGPAGNISPLVLQVAWELDMFGTNRVDDIAVPTEIRN